MDRSWVLIHRAPVVEPTGFLAFHPYREPGRVIRIPPMANQLMNADFDGDELAVFLPVSEAGQHEAGERLSIAAHLRRDPDLLAGLQPLHGARHGLALLGRAEAGLAEISQLAGTPVVPVDGLVGRAAILSATRRLLVEKGEDATLDAIVRLIERGYEEAKRSGISMPPFPDPAFARGAPPQSAQPAEWERYQEETQERLLAARENEASALYPYLLATLSGARGTVAQIPRYIDCFGLVEDVYGNRVPIRHSLLDGMSPEELRTLAVGSRRGQARAVQEIDQITRILWERFRPDGFGVLDRAMRSRHPGIVFARAAAGGETDPLTSLDSRMFVGL
jgi:DNA-directed RNA polymerase beta' subunit